MVLLPLLAVMALVLKCNATVRHGPRFPLNRVGFDSEKLIECAKKPTTQTLNAGEAIEIQSPKYPKNYPKTKCGWKLQVIGTDKITVSCSGFEMEKPDKKGICRDFFQIGDKKFCGKNGPKEVTINVKNSIELNFASNKKKSGSGFSCTVKAESNEPPPCSPIEFQCAPGECIPIWYACDGITDCSNGLDEIDCPPPCNSLEFRCKPGECIPIWHDCDGIAHCSNELDNFECPPPCNSNEFRCQPGECIPIEWDCDGITDCSNALDQFDCPKKWSDVRDACIKGNNNNEFPGVTIDECKEKCVNEESYICQSIEYYPKDQGCYLSEATSSSSDFHVPCFVSGWQYMEILQDPCETDKEWSDIRNACIKDNNNKDFKGVSIDVCKEKCFNEDSFNCQSIEYRSSNEWCFLSEAKSDSSDYYLPCYVDGWIYTEKLREGCVTAVCDPECLNDGICVGLDECRCRKEWEGNLCEKAVCEPECLNNGTCTTPNKCDCQNGWKGDHCETAACDGCNCINGSDGGNCSIDNTFDLSFLVNNKMYNTMLADTESAEFSAMKKEVDALVSGILEKTFDSNLIKFEVTAFQVGPPADLCPKFYILDDYNKNYFLKVLGEVHDYSSQNTKMDEGSGSKKLKEAVKIHEELSLVEGEELCEWNWKCPENRPIVLKGTNVFYPVNNGDLPRYRVEYGGQITMVCTGFYTDENKWKKKNLFSDIDGDKVSFTCGHHGMIYTNNKGYRMEDIECMGKISADIILDSTEIIIINNKKDCTILKIGFQENNQNDYHDLVIEENIQNSNFYFAKGHLAADADFVTKADQDASYFYINAVPQWQSINAGNWFILEDSIRQLAQTKGYDLTIITGGFEVLRLNHRFKKIKVNDKNVPLPIKINLGDQKEVPVPAVTWKVVLLKEGDTNKEGIAFITINNPYAEHLDIDGGATLSSDCSLPAKFHNFPLRTMTLVSCTDHRWGPFSKDITKGCTYCCDISALNAAIAAIGGVPYGPYVPAAADDVTDPNAFKFLQGTSFEINE